MKVSTFFLYIFLVVIFVFPSSAIADVNTDIFMNQDGFDFQYDVIEDRFSISPYSANLIPKLYTNNAAIYPSISGGGKSPFLFTLSFFTSTSRSLEPYSAVIKTDRNRYFFDISHGYSDLQEIMPIEVSIILCGETSLNMINEIITSKEVMIRIKGYNGDIDFEPSDSEIDDLSQLYDLYNKAGGIKENSIDQSKIDDKYNFSITTVE